MAVNQRGKKRLRLRWFFAKELLCEIEVKDREHLRVLEDCGLLARSAYKKLAKWLESPDAGPDELKRALGSMVEVSR